MILELLGAFVLGAIVTGCMVAFWDDIKSWLNNVAADAVERTFGYNARQCMHKAIATVDRVVSKLKNTSVIYSKKNTSDLYYDKTTIQAEMPVSELTEAQLREFDKHSGRMVQEFTYQR